MLLFGFIIRIFKYIQVFISYFKYGEDNIVMLNNA